MKFIFETEPESSRPVLADVEIDQFFIDNDGGLCQKRLLGSYIVIADSCGRPFSNKMSVTEDHPIEKVLPKVKKIEF